MINSEALKLQLVQDIIALPDGLLPRVREFLDNELTRNGTAASTEEYPSGHDPILDMIGMVSHGSLSANIDEELYGDSPL